jgi:hypothetical protein
MSNDHPEKPPFQRHWLYYPALKIAVLAVAVYLAFRWFGFI